MYIRLSTTDTKAPCVVNTLGIIRLVHNPRVLGLLPCTVSSPLFSGLHKLLNTRKVEIIGIHEMNSQPIFVGGAEILSTLGILLQTKLDLHCSLIVSMVFTTEPNFLLEIQQGRASLPY